MKLFCLLALGMMSTAAFAAQENRGVSLCSSASQVCESSDQKVVVCLFEQSDLAYVGLQTSPNETTRTYHVKEVPHAPGVMGAPLHYAGEGFDLRIVTDAAPTPLGHPGTVSVKDLKLKSKALRCKQPG